MLTDLFSRKENRIVLFGVMATIFVVAGALLYYPVSERKLENSVCLVESSSAYIITSDFGDTLYAGRLANKPSEARLSTTIDSAFQKRIANGVFVSRKGHLLTAGSILPGPDSINEQTAYQLIKTWRAENEENLRRLQLFLKQLDYYARTHDVLDENYNEVMSFRTEKQEEKKELDSIASKLKRMERLKRIKIELSAWYSAIHSTLCDSAKIATWRGMLDPVGRENNTLLLQTKEQRLPPNAEHMTVHPVNPAIWTPFSTKLRQITIVPGRRTASSIPAAMRITKHTPEMDGAPIVDICGHLVGLNNMGTTIPHKTLRKTIRKFAGVWQIYFAGLMRKHIDGKELSTSKALPESRKISFTENESYSGQIDSNGKRHGIGISTETNGNSYKGFWQNDRKHGKGKLITANNRSYEGFWISDTLPHGKFTDNEETYVGEFDRKLERQGFGYSLAHSETHYYSGEWNKGKRHGSGFACDTSDMVKSGNWEEDKFKGEQMNHHSNRIYGIDISRYQHDIGKNHFSIDWKKLRITSVGPYGSDSDYAVRFIYIKVTEGSSIKNRYYSNDIAQARRHGFPVGSYHFYTARPVHEQINFFLQNVSLRNGDLPPMLDLEPSDEQIAKMGGVETMFQGVLKWMKAIEKCCGAKPLLYVGQMFINRYYDKAPEELKQYPVWVARYSKYRPGVPLNYWQLTPYGRVSGIRGEVDINVFNGNEERFEQLERCEIKP